MSDPPLFGFSSFRICFLILKENEIWRRTKTKMILCNFISLRAFTVYMKNSLRFEISFRSNWPKWSLYRREFYFAWTHVNADNEVIKVTSNRSESFHEVVWVLLRFHVNPWSTDYIILMATYQNTKNLSKNAEIYYTQLQWANHMQCLKSKSIGREKW